jgi:hypothetical protein
MKRLGELIMDIEKVIYNIKHVDCPPDELQEKIKDACKVPGIDGNPVVIMDRNEKLDKANLMAYDIHIMNGEAPKIVAMVKEGQDGYVATVEDAFLEY